MISLKHAPRRAALAIALAACGNDINPDHQFGQPRPAAFNELIEINPSPARLSAAELLGVISVATEASIRRNNMAMNLGREPLVRNFAARSLALEPFDRMLLENALLRLGVRPVESETSSLFQQRAQQIEIMLQQQGVDFDRAFISAQIAAQRELIQAIDESSICSGLFVAGVPGTACSGFGGTSFAGDEPIPNEAFGQNFGETALFTAMRSSLLAQLTDAGFLQSMLFAPTGTAP